MAISSIKLLQTILLLCSLCILAKSDSRQSYSDRLKSTAFGCSMTENATTSFQNNLNLLLSDFNQQSSLKTYYNTTFGGTTTGPDVVYGYFMCRGDVSHQICNSCILNGTKMAIDAACKHVDGMYFSELCIFRYSNHNMYGLLEMNLTSTFDIFEENVSNDQQFNQTLSSTLIALINETAFGYIDNNNNNNRSISGFSTIEANVAGNETIYSLAQCTPDIVGVNCSICLHAALSQVRSTAIVAPAAISIRPKCELRYDNVSFYDIGELNVSKGENLRYLLVFYSNLFLFLFFNFL